MEQALDREPPSTPEPAALPVPAPLESTATERSTNRQPPADWVIVLDEELAQVLVERGLTPFDSGVAVHATAAGERLRQIESDYLEDGMANQVLRRDGSLTSDEWQELILLAKQQRRATRKATLAQLAFELDALVLAGADAPPD